MKCIRTIMIAVTALILASCSITSKSSFAPDRTQLNIEMSDLAYLGEMEVSVEYSSYLGIFKKIEKINGVVYDGKKRDYAWPTASVFGSGVKMDPMVSRALPKIYEKYPTAEYIIIVGQQYERSALFLGSEVNVKARVKVYSIKK